MAYVQKENPGIMLYWGTFDALDEMTDSETKQMLKAMRQYAQSGEEPDFTGSPAMRMAWCFLRDSISRDKERYEEIREQNRENGRKGGQASGAARRKNSQTNASDWGL